MMATQEQDNINIITKKTVRKDHTGPEIVNEMYYQFKVLEIRYYEILDWLNSINMKGHLENHWITCYYLEYKRCIENLIEDYDEVERNFYACTMEEENTDCLRQLKEATEQLEEYLNGKKEKYNLKGYI